MKRNGPGSRVPVKGWKARGGLLIPQRAYTRDLIPIAIGQSIRVRLIDLVTGEIQYGFARNKIMEAVADRLVLRWFEASFAITKVGLDEGTTAPAAGAESWSTTDVDFEDEIYVKAITSFDDTGLASIPPTRIVEVSFASTEANGPGTSYIRGIGLVCSDDTPITRTLFAQGTITDADQTDPVLITSAGCQAAIVAAGGGNGSSVFIEDVGGMVEINDRHFTIANLSTNSFELLGEDGTGHTAFTTGGKWTLEFVKTSSKVFEAFYAVGLSA